MNFLSDIWNNIQNSATTAYNTVDDIVRAAVDPVWNPPKTQDTAVEEPQGSSHSHELPEAIANPDTTTTQNAEPEEVDPSEPSRPLRDPKSSLAADLFFLRLEALANCEKKVKTARDKIRTLHEQNKTMTNLLQAMTANAEQNGSFEARDEQTRKLLADARRVGLQIPEGKHSFSKDERDAAVRNIELNVRNLDLELKLASNEAQEALQQRNTYYQELKTCFDKEAETIRKILQNMR